MHLEIVIGGIGGQGALTAGQLLAVAGMQQDKWVTNTPIYSPEVRGGSSNALVVMSDRPVGSMMVTQSDVGVFLAHQSVPRLLPTLKPGARVVYNSTLVPADSRRLHDVAHVAIPATDLATEVGDVRGANMVALGALTELEEELPLEWLVEALPDMLGPRKMRFLDVNKAALHRGAEAAREALAATPS
jgi:2-oxoglutarate ferredoxin oxidoreductase subunit gamma